MRVHVGLTPEADAQILWRKIAGRHFRVNIRVGPVGWAGGDSTMSLSRFDKLVLHIVVGEFDMFGEFDNREFLPHF